MIDFESSESHLLLNPRLAGEERARLAAIAPKLDAHIFVATSGTTGAIKLVALSKRAVLASAAAVNARLKATRDDIWCRVLPHFHVGGLGIEARAHLTSSVVLPLAWDPHAFASTDATLASLVPTQVHDLVRAKLKPPPRMRAILVGGGALDHALQREARNLGWPMLATYGMSECGSTVVIEDVLLDHLDARREEDGRLAFRGASLFTGYATEEGLIDPKIDGWFISEDFGEVDGRTLQLFGRGADFVKVGGESVDLLRLDAIARSIAGDDAAVIAISDARLGHIIHLAVTRDAEAITNAFNARVAPFERAREVHVVPAIPRSPLGKLLRAQLCEIIGR